MGITSQWESFVADSLNAGRRLADRFSLPDPIQVSVEYTPPDYIVVSVESTSPDPIQFSVVSTPPDPIQVSVGSTAPDHIQFSVESTPPDPIQFSVGVYSPRSYTCQCCISSHRRSWFRRDSRVFSAQYIFIS